MNLSKEFMDKVNSLSDELVDLLRGMVQRPSENPPGDERAVVEYITSKMSSYGLDAVKVEAKPKRVNAVGALPGTGENKAFLYNGHIDTVPAGNLEFWSVDPYEGVIKDGRMYGRATGDMKGAAACALIAARALDEVGIQLKGDFLIHCVADEETGSTFGTRYLIDQGYATKDKVAMAVCGEGSVHDDKIYAQLAIFGTYDLDIIVRGKSAHGSRPQEGINAVLKMSKILLALNNHQFRFTPHPLLPDPTHLVGAVIEGGIKRGVVPELCTSTFHIRAVPGMSHQGILEEINGVIMALKKEDPELNVELVPGRWREPSEMSTNDELFKIAAKVVKTVKDYELHSYPFSGWNDTVLLRATGIPTIVLGPADIPAYGGHGPDEWVSIDRLIDFAKIYGLMAMNICGIHEV